MKTLEEKIAVMQAAQRGEPIQVRFDEAFSSGNVGEWEPVNRTNETILWDWYRFDYRAKPREPREYWIVEPARYYARVFHCEREAHEYAGFYINVTVTHVREVQEDD